MNILLLPDSFKDSMASHEVAYHMELGIKSVLPGARVTRLSVSDGGEGFLEAVKHFLPEAVTVSIDTVDPLRRPLNTEFLINPATDTAYIELAKASGLELLGQGERNPLLTSTFGTGLQLKAALKRKVEKLYIGLGGSATNDGGTGIAEALGYEFVDDNREPITTRGGNLKDIEGVIPVKYDQPPQVYAINDVLNPLLGATGAAYTYARQKGAKEKDISQLESGMRHLVSVCKRVFGKDHSEIPGSGAAGGTAFGLKTFLDANFIPGVSFILQLAGFHELLTEHKIDLIITGEGKIDEQTIFGKMVSGVSREAAAYGIPVAALCGKLDLDTAGIIDLNLRYVRELHEPSQPEGYSFEHAAELIEEQTATLIRSIQQGSR